MYMFKNVFWLHYYLQLKNSIQLQLLITIFNCISNYQLQLFFGWKSDWTIKKMILDRNEKKCISRKQVENILFECCQI